MNLTIDQYQKVNTPAYQR